MMRELLIATTNPGKVKEILAFLEHAPFKFLTLKDLDKKIPAPDENAGTVAGNALLKARYYAAQTGLLTLADDSGFFIEALEGWPGVDASTIASSEKERIQLVLDRLEGVSYEKRTMHIQASLALVDPDSNVEFTAHGRKDGIVLEKPVADGNGFGYDPIIFIPELGKTYSQLTFHEKNAISQRGQALIRIKHHLENTYLTKHIVVPFAFIVKDGKVLMSLRNDPHRPEYHKKWEFPGGKVDPGEQMHENIIREIKEEVGYDVKVVKMLQYIAVEMCIDKTYSYQIFLVPYVCQIVGGDGKVSDGEVFETRWFDVDEVMNYEMIGDNGKMYPIMLPELKEVIKNFNL